MPVKPSPSELEDSYRVWIKNDIAEAPSRVFQLGKFLFTVSSASLGLVFTVFKSVDLDINLYAWFGIALFIIASGLALVITVPKHHHLGAETDLQSEHNALINSTRKLTQLWGGSWAVALIVVSASVAYQDSDIKVDGQVSQHSDQPVHVPGSVSGCR